MPPREADRLWRSGFAKGRGAVSEPDGWLPTGSESWGASLEAGSAGRFGSSSCRQSLVTPCLGARNPRHSTLRPCALNLGDFPGPGLYYHLEQAQLHSTLHSYSISKISNLTTCLPNKLKIHPGESPRGRGRVVIAERRPL